MLGLPISHSENLTGTPPIIPHAEFSRSCCGTSVSRRCLTSRFRHYVHIRYRTKAKSSLSEWTPCHEDIWENGGINLCELILDTKWIQEVSCTTLGKSSRHPMYREMSLPQSQFGCYKNTKFPPRTKSTPHHSSFSLWSSHHTQWLMKLLAVWKLELNRLHWKISATYQINPTITHPSIYSTATIHTDLRTYCCIETSA